MWNIVDRWGRYDGEKAVERFDRLAEAALGDHAKLFGEGRA